MGPEVVVRAIVELSPVRPIVLIGDGLAIARAVDTWGPLPLGTEIRDVSGGAELTEIRAIRLATRACLDGEAAGLMTGPINKEKLIRGGFAHTGHTDFLGELCGVSQPVMAFVGD